MITHCNKIIKSAIYIHQLKIKIFSYEKFEIEVVINRISVKSDIKVLGKDWAEVAPVVIFL